MAATPKPARKPSQKTLSRVPKGSTHLQNILRQRAALKEERDAIDRQYREINEELTVLLIDKGDDLETKDWKVALVQGETKRLDERLLLAEGVTVEQIARSTVTKAKKPYPLVSRKKG